MHKIGTFFNFCYISILLFPVINKEIFYNAMKYSLFKNPVFLTFLVISLLFFLFLYCISLLF